MARSNVSRALYDGFLREVDELDRLGSTSLTLTLTPDAWGQLYDALSSGDVREALSKAVRQEVKRLHDEKEYGDGESCERWR